MAAVEAWEDRDDDADGLELVPQNLLEEQVKKLYDCRELCAVLAESYSLQMRRIRPNLKCRARLFRDQARGTTRPSLEIRCRSRLRSMLFR